MSANRAAPKSIHGQAAPSETAGGYATSGSAEGRATVSDMGRTSWGLRVPASGTVDGVGFLALGSPPLSRLPTRRAVACWELALRSQWRDRAGLAPASPRHRLKCGRVYTARITGAGNRRLRARRRVGRGGWGGG